MPSVVLLRHAKSDWDASFGGDDRDRPLSRRGRAAAAAIGRFLASGGQIPSSAVTSPATRAVETLTLAMEAGGWMCPAASRERLYGASPAEVVDEIRECTSAPSGVLLVVGHEPTTSGAAALLIGGGRLRVPTATALRIDFDVDRWAGIEPGAGTLAWMVQPRLLG